MLKPWISDEGPRVPKDWGLAAFRGKTEPFFCVTCKKHILYREEYLYNFSPTGTIILHNKEECYAKALTPRD